MSKRGPLPVNASGDDLLKHFYDELLGPGKRITAEREAAVRMPPSVNADKLPKINGNRGGSK